MLFPCNAEDAYNSCENLRAAANPNQPRRQTEDPASVDSNSGIASPQSSRILGVGCRIRCAVAIKDLALQRWFGAALKASFIRDTCTVRMSHLPCPVSSNHHAGSELQPSVCVLRIQLFEIRLPLSPSRRISETNLPGTGESQSGLLILIGLKARQRFVESKTTQMQRSRPQKYNRVASSLLSV
jgi:hypothetical protein